MKLTAKRLAQAHGLNLFKPKYRESGDWYVQLTEFPSAFLDAGGFLYFPDAASYTVFLDDPENLGVKVVTHGTQVTIKKGISSHPDYRSFAEDVKESIDLTEDRVFLEGARKAVSQDRVERDPRARAACLAIWGNSCVVCGFNFSDHYGDIGDGFIHVHHLFPISKREGRHEVSAKRDLRPVCPNCHAMLHRRSPPYSIEELRRLLVLTSKSR